MMSPDLVPLPSEGRVFETRRRVSFDDCAPDGRMELDAIARFLQDAGNDDTDDAGLHDLGLAWIARWAVYEILEPARPRELLTLRTWCSGTGSRWAERRTQLIGDGGGHIEAVMLWIHIDMTSGRPTRWGEEFAAVYLQSAGGREVDARLRHPKRPPAPDDADVHVDSMIWSFRRSDMDAFAHVNNAAYLAIVEESLGGTSPPAPFRVEIEWRKASVAGERLTIIEQPSSGGVQGFVTADGDVRASYALAPLMG